MRIINHPILGPKEEKEKIVFYSEGQPIEAEEGDMVAVALMNAGIKDFRYTKKRKDARGVFCAIGRCTDCMVNINGKPNIRSCITLVENNMKVFRRT